MGWQDIYKKKMQAAGLENDIRSTDDVQVFYRKEPEQYGDWRDSFMKKMEDSGLSGDIRLGQTQTAARQTVTAPATTTTAAKKRERQVVSPYGTFLGGFSFARGRQKSEKELADEKAQQEAYLQEYRRLAGLDLDDYRAEVEQAGKKAQESKEPYNIHAFGAYNPQKSEAERTYAAMKADLNKAESIQYDIKGREALDNLTEDQTAALEVLTSTEGVPAAAAQADYDRKAAARETLLASGLSEDELSQLVNYYRNIPKREKNAERYAKVQEMARNEGEKSPIGGTLLSVPANLLSGVGTIDAALRKLADPNTPTDYNAPAMLPYAYASGVRGEVKKNLQYDYGEGAAFAYGVGTSMLDSAATAALAAMGVPPAAASATLGGAAATDAMVAAKDRGLDDDHAIATGVAAGILESFFEKVSLESLISMKLPSGTMKQRIVGMLKNTAIQAGIEGSEEVFTDIGNLLADKIINGDMTDVNQRIAVYMAGGMSYQEAQQKVVGETIKDMAVDFGAGALAGGLMGGGNMAVQTAVQHSNELTAERYRQFLQDAGVQLDEQQSAEDTALTEASDKYGAQAEVFRSTYTEGQDVALYDSAYRIAYEYGKAGAKEEAVMQQEDLSYLSETQRKIAYIAGREAAAWQNGLGENGSKTWAEVQNTDVESKGKLQAGFTALYQAGLRRESAVNVKSAAASALPQSVQTAAYEAGLSDAAASLAREKAGLDFVSSAGSESGLVDNEHARKMAKDQAGTAALLNTLGKNLGVRIEMVDTISGGKANGVYIGGKNLIRIAADANTAVEYVAAHEVTHRMQELAPEEYRAYRDHAMSYRAKVLGEETTAGIVARYMADAEDAGVKLTQEEAMDEIAADFTRDMMESGKLFEDFAKENRSGAKKLLDALKAFIAKVKSLFRSKAAQDRAAQDAYGKNMAELEQCVTLWQKAYDAAGKQAQRAKNAAREGDGEGRYQIRREFMREIDEWAKDGRPDGETFILGSTGPVLQGLGAIENDIFMESAKINKILVDHPEMTLEEIKRVPQILEDPVMVLKSKTRANSIVVFGTYRAKNGNPILAAMDLLPMKNRIFINGMQKVSSTYTKTGSRTQTAEEVGAAFLNSSEVLFLDKKRAAPVLRRMGIYTPIGLLRSGYIGSIALNEARVNIQGVPFAEVVDSGMQAKFSLKKPLEETKNLLALHNLTEKNLLDAVRLGGLPMPSIAVVKGDAGHSEYGPISFVFSKDTIDPQLFRSNKVYGYDAWTPTAPQIEYEVNGKAAGRIHDLFYRMQREKGRDFANPLYSVANTLEDELNRKGGLDKVVEPMRDDPRVMNIYLEDTGRGAVEKVMRQNVSRMDENQQEMSEFLISELGADAVDGFRATGNEAPIAARRRWFAEHGEALNEALRKYYEKLGLPAKDAANVVNAETNAAKTKYLLNTRKYLSGNTETVTEEVDLDATNNAIRKKVDKADYDRWLDELFKDVVKNEGIYNGKDYYTSSGNRRSFSATHYEITLENIVKAMKRGDQKGTNTFFGGQAIWGVASKDYNSIDEIKADSGRLVKMTEEEYSAIRQEYSARLAELANEIKDPAARNDFIASDDAATAIVETLRTKRTAAAIDKELRTYPTLHIRPGTAGKVLQLFEDISNMPTGYFEAKPQRAVGFDEVLAAVIPDDTSAGARAALAQAGVKTIEYKSGDEQSRTDAVNSVEGARFQLKSATELEQEVRELTKYAAYRQRGTTDREILLSAADGSAKTEWERKRLAEYRDAVGRLEGYEAHLSANRAELTGLSLADGKKNAKRISYLKDEITKDTNRVAIVENKLKDLEGNRSLQELLERERAVLQQQERTYLGKVEELLGGYRGLYGTMRKGEKAARDIQLPKKSGEDEKISQTVRTVLEAKATPEEMVPDIETLALEGKYSYEVYSDKAAIADADGEIKRVGWAQALTDWKSAMKAGNVSKKNTAMGWALYNNAANSGDTETALDVLSDMVQHQRSAAQALQATRILKQLSPETQLYQAQRSIAYLQTQLNGEYGDDKAPALKIDQTLAEQFMKAADQAERDAVLANIYRDIGKQMPSRFRDKWNAWRYLAMLGNVRTHVRNVVGNAGFVPVVAAKNVVATGIEKAVYRLSGGKMERSKEFVTGKGGKALLEAAAQDYAKVADIAMGGGKYSDFANANKYIDEGRVIFKTKPLEAARKANSRALDKEDSWFSKPHYAYAMAQYCKANGITAEMIAKGGDKVVKAREYAIREAQKATYRDTNAFSQAISELGRMGRNSKNGAKRTIATVMEGILPFRKTPANILARGVEYSPIGFLRGMWQATVGIKKGTTTAAEAIDSISAGLTGTGLLALGLFLAAQGVVRGHGDDDDKKNDFMELAGHQAYALELPNGTSITLDWLAPECLPFFVGVNLWELTDGGDKPATMADWLTAISQVSEPMLEMSCLQSLNDVFDSVGYASSNGLPGLPTALANAATSYVAQGIPTILGQAERTGEGLRYTTFTSKNSKLTNDVQYALGRASAKIPIWDYSQIPFIDAWGRTESTGEVGTRAFNNFLNPAYTSTVDMSAMEQELLRLYEVTGENVFPSRAKKYFNADNQEINLTGEQYVTYAQKKGGEAYKWLTELTQSAAYRNMSNEEKVECIDYIYKAANEVAKAEVVSSYEPTKWVKEAMSGAGVANTAIAKTAMSGMTGEDYDGDGKSDAYSKIDKQLAYIDGLNLTAAQKRAMAIAFDIKEKTIDTRAPW